MREITDLVIGKTEAEAKEIIEQYKYAVRVTAREGEYYMVTQDFNTNRVNIQIMNGLVINSTIG